MPLTLGERLGPYEILAPIGAGGMGEVYRARDGKLNRDVAIKVLPELFASDPDRLARFSREAQTLAALNHPNIAHIYGLEAVGSVSPTDEARPLGHALVMELVEGEDLSALIGRGPMPLAEAIPIARQIADALEAAHEQGIVHRDLKPANVKIRPDGTVKVLDFGLAKAMDPAGASAVNTANSPTLTAHATQMGMIIGTAAYMAPEQARGRAVDRRADTWAFGVILFEMLTGHRAFEGDDISITLAAVLKDDVRWSALPADLPASVRRVLRRCLEKDPKRRQSSIGDARLELEEPDNAPPTGVEAPGQRPVRASWLVVTAAAAAGIILTALVMFQVLRPTPPARAKRLSVVAPENAELFPEASESAISPDGKMVAFVTGTPLGVESTQLWVRPLDAPNARLIQGISGARQPFWSPDSRRIGFFADGKLKTVAAEGGRLDVVCAAPDGRGGAWSAGGVIVFAPSSASSLLKVAAGGSEPSPVTALDSARKETGHRFPFFLPDGRHFLFAALPARNGQYNIFIGTLDGAARLPLLSAESTPVYTEPGYLLFTRKGVVVAQPFDASRLRLSGDAMALDDTPGDVNNFYNAGPAVSASAGALVYVNDPWADTRLAWVNREGRETGAVDAAPARYTEIRLAPDGERAAVVRAANARDSAIWILDLVRHGATRLAEAPHLNYRLAWSPDGKRLAYANDGSGTENIFVRDAAAATPAESLYASADLFKKPQSWSPDGRVVLFTQRAPETQNDLMLASTSGDRPSAPYLHDPFNEDNGRFSPDGRWVAYTSDEAGSSDVYVRSFPVPDRKYRVTTDGGTWVWWKQDGTSLLILGADSRQLKVADVRSGVELSIAAPTVVGALPAGAIAWDAGGDLQHLLVSLPKNGTNGLSLMVVTDWASALTKR